MALASWNATVIGTARTFNKASRVEAELLARVAAEAPESTGRLALVPLDLSDFYQVDRFAKAFTRRSDASEEEDEEDYGGGADDQLELPFGLGQSREPTTVHGLILNAGYVYKGFDATPDGIETMYQVNFLSHQKLSLAMLPSLSRARPSARIVHVSSSMHTGGKLSVPYGEVSPYSADARNLDPDNRVCVSDGIQQRYCDVKLMQVLFSNELNARLAERAAASSTMYDDEEAEEEEQEEEGTTKQTVFSNAIHPGFVLTDLDRDMGFLGAIITIFRRLAARPARVGAVTQVRQELTPRTVS